ncbi:C4b-binding protein alpha chain-like [Aulostomus maculatus]
MGVLCLLFVSYLGLAVTAVAQECPRPVGGANMVLKGDDILSDTFADGSKVTFMCESGYQTAGGTGSITCTAGVWSPVKLKCEKKNCGPAEELQYGLIDYSEGTEFGARIVAKCNVGYIAVGRTDLTCGDKGWMGRLPVCEVVKCDRLPPVVNGSFSPDKDSYDYTETVFYKCLKDLVINGSESVTCSENGSFQPNPPKCVKVSCPDVFIANGEFVQGSRPPHGYKDTLTFQCKPRFRMVGSPTVTCELNSQWSPKVPSCDRIPTTPKATAPTPTTTKATTTTTAAVHSKTPTDSSDPTDKPGNDGSSLSRSLGIALGVIIGVAVFTICGCYFCGVPASIKKWRKHSSRKGYSLNEATNGAEEVALS